MFYFHPLHYQVPYTAREIIIVHSGDNSYREELQLLRNTIITFRKLQCVYKTGSSSSSPFLLYIETIILNKLPETIDTVELQVIFYVTAVPKRHSTNMTVCQSETNSCQRERGRWTCFARIFTAKDDGYISEYEQLRNKNIQENLSVLRLAIFFLCTKQNIT